MELIKLTQEHQYRLLEMCKELFKSECKIDCYITPTMYIALHKKHFITPVYIHWFEFCITFLSKKLYNLNNRNEISTIELYIGNIVQNYHPVYYLYKEYEYYLSNLKTNGI